MVMNTRPNINYRKKQLKINLTAPKQPNGSASREDKINSICFMQYLLLQTFVSSYATAFIHIGLTFKGQTDVNRETDRLHKNYIFLS